VGEVADECEGEGLLLFVLRADVLDDFILDGVEFVFVHVGQHEVASGLA